MSVHQHLNFPGAVSTPVPRIFPSQLCCLCQSLPFTRRSWSENSKQSACCFGTKPSGKRSCTKDANDAIVAHNSAVSPLVLPSPAPFRSKAQIPHDPTRLADTWHRMGLLPRRTAPPQVNPQLRRAMANPLCVLEGCARGECGLFSSWSKSASQRACVAPRKSTRSCVHFCANVHHLLHGLESGKSRAQ